MGVIKKRKKRNIIKVSGKETSECQRDDETTKFSSEESQWNASRITPDSCRIEKETGMFRKGVQRITRDPNFHRPFTEESLTELEMQPVVQIIQKTAHSCPMEMESASMVFKDNLTLLNKTSMNRLRLIIYLGAISGALPWKWDGANRQILLWTPRFLKFWWIQWTLISFQTVCLFGIQLWLFNGSLAGEVTSYRSVFITSIPVYWYLCAVLYRLIVYLHEDGMRSYINSMLRFNQDYIEKYLVDLEGYKQVGMIVMNLSIPTASCQIGASLALFLIYHKHPMYVTSQIIPDKNWYWLIPGALHDVMQIGSLIAVYMLMAWTIVAHASTVDFWLQECHQGHPSRFTSAKLRKSHIATKTYRSLSVLNSLLNDSMAGLGIPILKIVIAFGIILSGYVVVRSMNHVFIDEFPSILLYPFGIINCVATGFGFIYTCAHMHDLGVSFVDSWSQTQDKGLRRFMMSCSTMKVWVGRFYFVTVATIITFFRIIADQIISCIITFP